MSNIWLSVEQPSAPQVILREEVLASELREHLAKTLGERPSMYKLREEVRLELSAHWPAIESAIDDFIRARDPDKSRTGDVIRWEF